MTGRIRDVVFVGGGYRTVSFLSSQPWLLEHDVEVLERSDSFGGGAFADYDCTSTSVSNRFVGKVSPEVAALVPNVTQLRELQRSDSTPLPLTKISAAMEDIGRAVEAKLDGNGRVRRCCVVTRVRVTATEAGVETERGEFIRSRHVVIATGREERPHPALSRWAHKTIRSSELISFRRTADILARIEAVSEPVVIAGGSHSAIAGLLRLIRLREQCGRPALPLVMLRRSLARLHYRSLGEAHAERDRDAEAPIDPIADVCPATGQVNRDSGLRGVGRGAYRRLVSGEIPYARVQRAASLDAASDLLDEAGLIVQALGYHGRAPIIEGPHGIFRPADSPSRLINLSDGVAVIDTRPVQRLSVLRVEPTPKAVRDHGLYGQTLYDTMARRLKTDLEANE